jgi:transcriptional regulator with XRE-family HTH domain
VEQLRNEAGLTQEQLADRMGIEFPPLGNLERGLTNPTFSSLVRLAHGLDVELSVVILRYEQCRQDEN